MTQASNLIKQRFNELETQMRNIRMISNGHSDNYADYEQFYSWSTSALNVIQGCLGNDSPHYVRFKEEMANITNNYVWSSHFKSMCGIFLGAKSDVDGGYLFNFERSISGELFGNLVEAAKSALEEGHYTVACILACAALEDALKRYAISQGLQVEGQTMETVVNALKGKGLVSGAQKSLLAAMPKVRNNAMHAEWDKLSPQDAGSVIGFVEQFLLANF